eukprot:1653179-Amphidinium_carterae.2
MNKHSWEKPSESLKDKRGQRSSVCQIHEAQFTGPPSPLAQLLQRTSTSNILRCAPPRVHFSSTLHPSGWRLEQDDLQLHRPLASMVRFQKGKTLE